MNNNTLVHKEAVISVLFWSLLAAILLNGDKSQNPRIYVKGRNFSRESPFCNFLSI